MLRCPPLGSFRAAEPRGRVAGARAPRVQERGGGVKFPARRGRVRGCSLGRWSERGWWGNGERPVFPLPQAQVATGTQTGNECKAPGAGVTGRWGREGGEGPLCCSRRDEQGLGLGVGRGE